MKYILIPILFFSFTSNCQIIPLDSTMSKASREGGYQNTSQEFRQFHAKDLNGNSYSTDSLINKITFINFWMENCAPCLAEFGALNDLYTKYRTDKRFQFISFTYETKENVFRLVNKYKIQYPIICLDMQDIYRLNFSLGFPTNLIAGRSAEIKFIKCGGFDKMEKVKEEFENVYSKLIEAELKSSFK
jgi:cytochrome c biogenesis protein CcmG/thiol:disulfide interchange protein DsbE